MTVIPEGLSKGEASVIQLDINDIRQNRLRIEEQLRAVGVDIAD